MNCLSTWSHSVALEAFSCSRAFQSDLVDTFKCIDLLNWSSVTERFAFFIEWLLIAWDKLKLFIQIRLRPKELKSSLKTRRRVLTWKFQALAPQNIRSRIGFRKIPNCWSCCWTWKIGKLNVTNWINRSRRFLLKARRIDVRTLPDR